MTRASRTTPLATTLLLSCGLAHAGGSSLGIDPSLALLSFGDLSVSGSSISGGVAVGGNAAIKSYSIDGGSAANSLVVGGNLAFDGGSITGRTLVGGRLTSSYGGSFAGDVSVGGTLDASAGLADSKGAQITVFGSTIGVQPWYPTVSKGSGSFSTGLDFVALESHFDTLSGALDASADTGTATLQWGTLTFDAKGQNVAVFDIDASVAGNNMQIVGLAPTASVIINVHGSTVDFGNHGYSDFASGQVLFNLPDATAVTFNGGATASFLAPRATFSSGSGSISGQVIVDSWVGGSRITDVAFAGMLPDGAAGQPAVITPVPEPHAWALLLSGLLVAAVVARRRRRA
jgi:choice-of-anchor A domain-containing protein